MLENPDDSLSEDDNKKEDRSKLRLGDRGRDMRYTKFKQHLIRPTIPKMLELLCNTTEVMRLRHILVELTH